MVYALKKNCKGGVPVCEQGVRRMAYRESVARKSLQQKWENLAPAARFDANELARLNGVSPEAELKAGQEIRLPATAGAAPSRRR